MADTKIVGGKPLTRECEPKRPHHHHDAKCDCRVDGRTIVGNGTKKHPFEAIDLFPQKFASPPDVKTIFVRADGSDKKGDGETEETAFRTIQRATLEIPLNITGGVYYVIDATGLIEGGAEVLPPNYELPAWKAPRILAGVDFDRNNYRGAVTVQAEPRDVPALGADAVIELGDLESTEVGTSIVSSTGGVPGTPILITTMTPHKLVQSPTAFGIFGVFAGVVQVVEISGNSQLDANGIFFALVTKPTVDESTTFELYDFNLDPVIGTGPGVNGTVTVLFVKDQHSGQTQFKLSTPRESWGPDGSLKGKLLTGAGDSAVIYHNTADTLYLASNGEPGIFAGPVRIQEPSCALQCSDSEVFSDDGYVGGFNVVNIDSICFSGIEMLAAPDGSSLLHSGGVGLFRECSLQAPKFGPLGDATAMESHLMSPSYIRVGAAHDRCLVENVSSVDRVNWDAFHGTVIINEESVEGEIGWVLGVKIISSANPVLLANKGVVWWCGSIESSGSGDAIVIQSQDNNQLFNVGGSGWPGTALVVDNGAQVEVDVFSFLKTDEMQVGVLPLRMFGDFRTNLINNKNQFDLVGQNAGATDQSTGSRVFEKS